MANDRLDSINRIVRRMRSHAISNQRTGPAARLAAADRCFVGRLCLRSYDVATTNARILTE